jgi:hypothetical protein
MGVEIDIGFEVTILMPPEPTVVGVKGAGVAAAAI